MPRDTLQGLVVAQARNLFTVDASAENPPSLQEIDELAKTCLPARWISGLSRAICNKKAAS